MRFRRQRSGRGFPARLLRGADGFDDQVLHEVEDVARRRRSSAAIWRACFGSPR